MNPAQKPVPAWEQVRDLLGEKVVASLAASVVPTREDLTTYRETFPLWVSQHTERGLASWIHDRMWAHLSADLGELPGVFLTEKEPIREVTDGTRYRLRIKRHSETGAVRSYPTKSYLDFLFQTNIQETFDGLEEINLIAGYEWISDEREIGDALISLRTGRKIYWVQRLTVDDESGASGDVVARPIQPTPPPPVIETLEAEDSAASDEE